MNKPLLTFWIILFLGFQGIAQNRTIDGTGNNTSHSEWGSAGHQLRTLTTVGFEDGISSPSGTNRSNPRIISNTMFAQDSLIMDALALSDYTWVFGQFIDHDVIATPGDPSEDASVNVDFPDVHFNPSGSFPFIQIHMSRSMAHPGTGTDINNPRKYTNDITSWIDGSGVYGSDDTRASYLRTFSDGKLKTSADNLLPFNTETHEFGGTIDDNAPFMENENPFNDQLFVAGDSRANENVALAAFHTIFVREHNRLCDELAIEHPSWTDEELYQYARKMVGGFIQSIVYNEWLPVMGVDLPAYSGYDSALDPTISNVFSAAAFRLGHTLLSGIVPRMDNNGNTIADGNLTLLEAFFAPYELVDNDGIDPIFKGLATQVEQEMDCKVVDDVRNFLFGPPQAGLGGLDLASININRGRERGLPDFNTIRSDFNLTPYASFLELNTDPAVAATLASLYDNVNDIDPWVGMLAENHMSDALFGETIMKILEEQFFALREGDRFYFENDPGLSATSISEIQQTTFRDIIMRNTNITLMQENVFKAMPHDSICSAESAITDVTGGIQTDQGTMVEGVTIEVNQFNDGELVGNTTTEETGEFLFAEIPSCDHYEVTAEKNYNHGNGISTFDLIFIRRHILGIEFLDDPYKVIAADADFNGNVTTLDLVDLRKLILSIQDTLSSNKSWRFVDANTTFANPNQPTEAIFDKIEIENLEDATTVNFVGIKIGDVTGNADPELIIGEESDDRNHPETLTLTVVDQKIEAGKPYNFIVPAEYINELAGIQFALDIDEEALQINEVIPGDVANINVSNFGIDTRKGTVAVSWENMGQSSGEALFIVNLIALEDGQLSDFIRLNQSLTKAEAYSSNFEHLGVSLYFASTVSETGAFTLYQNKPNPFDTETEISFMLPLADEVELLIYDASGKIVYQIEQSGFNGYNSIQIQKENLLYNGVFYYQLNTRFGTLTKKMILVK